MNDAADAVLSNDSPLFSKKNRTLGPGGLKIDPGYGGAEDIARLPS